MAAETEDPVSLQVDYLPTGSISFGRFETESLDWGRRSTFSHNRYLEEVEKCSKPGSVIEKKAYFEAHFKKKALLRQASSESHSGTEDHSSENAIMDPMSNNQEYKDGKEQHCHTYHEETVDGSDDLEYEIVESETVEEILPNEFQIESCNSDDDSVSELDIQNTEPCGSNQNHFKYENCLLDYCGSEHEDESHENEAEILKAEENPGVEPEASGPIKTAEDELKVESGDVGEVFEMVVTSPKTDGNEKDQSNLGEEKHTILEVKTLAEQKHTNEKLEVQVPCVQSNNQLSMEKAFPSKESNHGPRKMKSPLRIKAEKQTQLKVSTGPISKDLKPKDSGNLIATPSREKKSTLGGKDRKEKTVCPQPLTTSGRREAQKWLPSSRSKQITSFKKTDATKLSATGFNFKCDERAEKRKEFYSRLEEKMHAKEVEMNQIQARTQEEAEAKMKQLRRSLNFKATPMPSFYHDAGSRGLESNKPAASTKSAPLPNKLTTGNKTRIQENPSSSSRIQRTTASCTSSDPEHATNCPEVSGTEGETRFASQPSIRHDTNEIRKSKEVRVGGAVVKAENKERDKSSKVQQPVGRGEDSALGRRRGVGSGKVRKGLVGGTSGVRSTLVVGVVAS